MIKKETDLDETVKQVYNFYSANYKGQSEILPLLPAVCNGPAIRQVYSNLLSNAIKYSSKTPAPYVAAGCFKKEDQVVYYVKDNGVGLSQQQLRQMFTPFKRFHSEFEGNGLGLVIVKRIIEKHGGNIWAESQPGKGLTVFFTLSADLN